MQIYSIYYTHKPGGFCKRLYRLLNALAQAGYQVTYAALDAPPSALSAQVKFQQIPFPIKQRSGVLFWGLFTVWAPLFVTWQAQRQKINKIVVFGAYYAFVSLLAHRITGAKIVLFVRSLVFKINQITNKAPTLCWLSDMFERSGMRNTDTLIAMSKTMAQELHSFIGIGSERVINILPNDVPPKKYQGKELTFPQKESLILKHEQNKILLLISGVYDQRKNLSLVIEAFKTMAQRFPEHPFELVVAGEGPCLIAARLFVAQNALQNITFLGWVDDLDPLYPFISLVIHPARHEGMPNSVLEAWGYGIPALLAATPELKEMAPRPELWLTQDSSAELADKLIEISNNRSHLEVLRQATLDCAQALTFDWESAAVKFIRD